MANQLAAIVILALSVVTLACSDDGGGAPIDGGPIDGGRPEGGQADGGTDSVAPADASAPDAPPSCPGAPGDLDPSFGTGGIVRFDPHPDATSSSRPLRMALQPDGKLIVAGPVASRFQVVRLLPDGSPDPSFGTDGFAVDPAGADGGLVGALARVAGIIATDQEITVIGRQRMLRLRPDGSPDTTLGADGTIEIPPETSGFALQADGKILLAGRRETGMVYDGRVSRITRDGALDPTFGTDGHAIVPLPTSSGVSNFADVVLAGDRIVAGGFNVASRAWFVAFDANGTQDVTFGADGELEYTGTDRSSVMSLIYDPSSGRVHFASFFRDLKQPVHDTGVVTGSFLPGDGSGLVTKKHVYPFENEGSGKMAMTPAGRFVVAAPYARDLAVLRLDSAGSVDPTFGTDGFARAELPTEERNGADVAVSADGQAVLAVGVAISDFGAPTETGEVIVTKTRLCP